VGCFILIQIKIFTNVAAPALKVLWGQNLRTGDEMDRIGHNRKEKLNHFLQL
jgi:hypothetical protein